MLKGLAKATRLVTKADVAEAAEFCARWPLAVLIVYPELVSLRALLVARRREQREQMCRGEHEDECACAGCLEREALARL